MIVIRVTAFALLHNHRSIIINQNFLATHHLIICAVRFRSDLWRGQMLLSMCRSIRNWFRWHLLTDHRISLALLTDQLRIYWVLNKFRHCSIILPPALRLYLLLMVRWHSVWKINLTKLLVIDEGVASHAIRLATTVTKAITCLNTTSLLVPTAIRPRIQEIMRYGCIHFLYMTVSREKFTGYHWTICVMNLVDVVCIGAVTTLGLLRRQADQVPRLVRTNRVQLLLWTTLQRLLLPILVPI
jgi:hypothetical protein